MLKILLSFSLNRSAEEGGSWENPTRLGFHRGVDGLCSIYAVQGAWEVLAGANVFSYRASQGRDSVGKERTYSPQWYGRLWNGKRPGVHQ